jgi:ligand-binding sensor domain-containing protein
MGRPASAEWIPIQAGSPIEFRAVNTLMFDTKGDAWLGLDQGLAFYDGLNWKVYGTSDGLPQGTIGAVLEDRNGTIWATINGVGVGHLEGNRWQVFTTADGLPADFGAARALLEDQFGNIWTSSYSGFARYDRVSWRVYPFPEGSSEVAELVQADDGSLWAGANTGILHFDGNAWTYAVGAPRAGVYDLLKATNGAMWFGTIVGAVRFDGHSWKTYSQQDGLRGNVVNVIAEDSTGHMWAATYGGIARQDGDTWHAFGPDEGVPWEELRAITCDRAGTVWTSGSGIYRFDGRSWKTALDRPTGTVIADPEGGVWADPHPGLERFDGDHLTMSQPPPYSARCLLRSRDRSIWAGTDEGVFRFDGTRWVDETANLTEKPIYALAQDSAGWVWAGTVTGISRFDGTSWRFYGSADGLTGGFVVRILVADRGDVWAGTNLGVARYDGLSWSTPGSPYLVGNVSDLVESPDGAIWASTYSSGLSRFDGMNWQRFTRFGGGPSDSVSALAVDRDGRIWAATYGGGVGRYDGAWRTYTFGDSIANNIITGIHVDRQGYVWASSQFRMLRFDGSAWEVYGTAESMGMSGGTHFLQDSGGGLWVGEGGRGNLARFDGHAWRSLHLAGDGVQALVEDSTGGIWIAMWSSELTHLLRDRIGVHTAFDSRPPPASANRIPTISYGAGYRQTSPVSFSSSLDSEPWSTWTNATFWPPRALEDGVHVFQVHARDDMGNTGAIASCTFEIDATPPTPVIATPTFGQAVSGTLAIGGTADDLRFAAYAIDVRPEGETSWEGKNVRAIGSSSSPVRDDTLATWNTSEVTDGNYEVRLAVSDTFRLTATTIVRVVVDNAFPHVDMTTPVRVSGPAGGHVYTTDREVHLYLPPHALSEDAVVRIEPIAAGEAPDSLRGGIERVGSAYHVAWDPARLTKPATLELSTRGLDLGEPSRSLALYASFADGSWTRLGGTAAQAESTQGSFLHEPASFALFLEPGELASAGTPLSIALAPRVFSPRLGVDGVAVGFTLPRAGPVSVRVFNRAGRVVREVVHSATMGAGNNLVRWDGRDEDARVVPDGIYLVTVESGGVRQTATVAVVP